MICLAVLFEVFINALFMQSDEEGMVQCGTELNDQDAIVNAIIEEAVEVIVAAVILAPIMVCIAIFLEVDEK